MSVPTTLAERSGNRKSIDSPKKTPVPTEVSPTIRPPMAPDRDGRDAGRAAQQERRVAVLVVADEALRRQPERAEHERTGEDACHHRLGAVAVRRRAMRVASQTPRIENGALPRNIQPRQACMHRSEPAVPHGACGLEDGAVAPGRFRSRAIGLNPNTITSSGVISEPPPMPVRPTSPPISRPESDELPVH